jgi:hypothetical protein
MIYYLSSGNAAVIKNMKDTPISSLHKYYLLNRARDLNALLDHIAHLKYLRRLDEKNAGKY